MIGISYTTTELWYFDPFLSDSWYLSPVYFASRASFFVGRPVRSGGVRCCTATKYCILLCFFF